MKKLLFVLMFGLTFSQALIETREYIINLNGFEDNLQAINMMELIGETDGIYTAKFLYSDIQCWIQKYQYPPQKITIYGTNSPKQCILNVS